MMCSDAKQSIAASWIGELDAPSEAALRRHVQQCEECAAEMAQLGAIWEQLGDMPVPEPSRALDVRWASTIQSLVPARQHNFWRPALPAAACLLIGLALGALWQRPSEQKQIARLREEVANTKDMVALSLLQQQSATERLRGVGYSQRMPSLEPQVVSALIDVVQHDPNVNVRLAAVDALTRVSGDAGVRRSLTNSIPGQESPMVQAALIDYVVDAKDPNAAGTLKRLAELPNVNPAVRRQAGIAVRQLTQYR